MSQAHDIKLDALRETLKLATVRFSGINSEVTTEIAKNESEYIETIYKKLQELYTDEKSAKNQ